MPKLIGITDMLKYLYLKYEKGKRVRARDITSMEYSNKAVIGQTIKCK